MKKLFICLVWLLGAASIYAQGGTKASKRTFTVLQLNIWHEGSHIPDGYKAILDVLDEVDADVVLLCEIRNRDGKQLIPRLIDDLAGRGKTYYGETLGLPVGILSKYRLEESEKRCVVPGDEGRAMLRAAVTIAGEKIAFYSCHLDYTHYECYLPRGYSGTSWEKIERPITEEMQVLSRNRLAYRDESIRAFVDEVSKDIDAGLPVILGGDFNEPSHLDWQEDTKELWDHNGAVINWDCSVLLHNAGFVDTYRENHPDPVKYPGFTFPAGNQTAEAAKMERLAWAPEADERDRIDFIYYHPASEKLSLRRTILVGPAETVVRGRIEGRDSKDKVLVTKSIWPSDHKGNLATFRIKK